MKVTPQDAGTITNQAGVTSELADPDTADASASENTTVEAVADLSLTKTDSPDPVLAGELLTYTLAVAQRRARRAPPASIADRHAARQA